MITIFNRKELTTVYSMKRQAEIRALLTQKKVAYSIKTINRKSSSPFASGSRACTGTYGERLEVSFEYIFYVKKQDFALAKSLLKQSSFEYR